MRKFNTGFSVLELMMVMVIGVAVATLSWTVYRSARVEMKVNQQADLFRYLMTSADSITMTSNGYQIPNGTSTTPITASAIINLTGTQNMFPAGSSGIGSTIYGPLGQVTVSTDSSAGSINDLFVVSTALLPSKECLGLVIKMAPGIYDIRVNNNLVKLTPEPANGALGRSDAEPAQVATLCANATNTVVVRKLKSINFAAMRHDGFGSFTGNEETVITPLYNRTEAAMSAREAAQSAL